MAVTPAPMSANQTAYLNGLVKAGGGNAEWAKAQLGAVPAPIAAQTQGAMPPASKASTPPLQGYASGGDGIIGAIAGAYNSTQNPSVGGSTGLMGGIPAIPKPQGTFNPPSTAGDSQPPAMPVAATQSTPAPMSQGSYPGQLTNAQIAAEAQARIDKQRAAITEATNAANAARKNVFDYTNQITGDNRTLENGAFNETHNPFSGQTGYAQAQLQRNRSIQDTANNNNYQADITANNQKVTDFETLAPEQQQAILDGLTRQERDYGLQVGTLTGQFNGSPTLAAQGQSAQYTGVYGGQPTLQAQNQSFQQNLATNQNQQQQQNTQFNQNMQNQQFAYTQARDAIKDQQYQQTFDNNVKQQGLDYALKQATLANQITNDQAQRAIGYMNANTSQQNANTSSSNASWAQNPNNPDNLYKQSEIAKNNAPAPKSTDYKTDPNFASDVAHLKASPTDAAKLDSNPQPFITAYGYDGYLALRKAAGLQDPTAP